MKLRWALGVALFLAGAPVKADDARPADVSILRTCLGTNRLPAERRPCIGRVSEPCMKQPGGDSTIGMTQCYDREVRAWDAILNQTYARVQASFNPAGKSYIKEVQTSWIEFRDQSCDWPYKIYPDGTIHGPLAVECLQDATAERTITLLEIAESLNPD